MEEISVRLKKSGGLFGSSAFSLKDYLALHYIVL